MAMKKSICPHMGPEFAPCLLDRLRAEHWAGTLRISTLLMSLVVADYLFIKRAINAVKGLYEHTSFY